VVLKRGKELFFWLYCSFVYCALMNIIYVIWPTTVVDGKLSAGSHFTHEVPGVALVAQEDSYFVAYSSAPIGEPVVAGGPFVMNTREEIAQAFADYRRGLFGPVPNW
jgi:redox-sensitive bicupin YhaK (pirin superfamily)